MRKPPIKHDRKTGIGGTDIAAIVGESPYRSILDVYMEKRGLSESPAETPAMKWGKILEEPIAKEYASRHDLSPTQLIKVELDQPLRDSMKEFVFATPDRIIPVREQGLEVKAPGLRMANQFGVQGSDEVPPYYIVQMQWYMGVTMYPVWDLAVLLGGQDYREYQVKKDDELIGTLRELAERFWVDNVQKGVAPLPEASQAAKEALVKLYPENKGHFIEATAEDMGAIETLKAARNLISKGTRDKMEAENYLKSRIADADGMESPFGKITWKRTKGSVKVDYKSLVVELDPPQDVLEKHTTITNGVRRFNVPRKWSGEEM